MEILLLAFLRLVSMATRSITSRSRSNGLWQQIYSFIRNDDVYSDPCGMAAMLGPWNPLFRAMHIMKQVLLLRKELLSHLAIISTAHVKEAGARTSNIDPVFETTRQTLQLCFQKLDEFDAWDREAASFWQMTFVGRPTPGALGQAATNTTIYDAETACIVVLIRSARLTLLVTMLQYCDEILQSVNVGLHLLLGDRTAWEECRDILERDIITTIDDILASVPYALGDVSSSGGPGTMPYDGAGAIVILHAIRLLTCYSYAAPDQMQLVKGILTRMNAQMGIRAAVSVAEAEIHARKLSSARSLSC